MAIGIILYLAFVIFMIASHWKILTKAGQPGWSLFIPFYNAYIMLKLIDKPFWWVFLFCIPLVNIYFIIHGTNLLSKKFGKDTGFTAGLILLPFIFYPILGFGDAQYQGAVNESSDLLDS